MAKFFISYSRKDRLFVDLLIPMLLPVYGNDSVWFDAQILGGDEWWELILREIRACDIFLMLISDDSLQSPYCQDECREALRAGKLVLPIVVRPRTDIWGLVAADLAATLRKINYLDLSAGFRETDAVTRLYGSINRLIERLPNHPIAPVTTPPPPEPASVAQSAPADVLPAPFAWRDIPAGSVFLADASHAAPAGTSGGRFQLEPYQISQYPVTNAQFQVFVDAPDGYCRAAWWEFCGDALRWRNENSKPRPPAFPGDDLPRTNVCWYEAVAFCQWLSQQTHQRISLPTEQQWQRAGQGEDGRAFPWGDVMDRQRCNFRSSGVTPVTRYPSGASPFGVFDLTGNVLEWCLNEWTSGDASLTKGSRRVMKGGSWYRSGEELLRLDYRAWNYADFRVDNRGFRIVQT